MKQWTLVLMIFLLLLCSCSRREAEKTTPLSRPIAKEASEPAPSTEITLQKDESLVVLPLTPAKQEHIMLPLVRQARSLPEDFKIGLLQDQLYGYGEQSELLATVRDFFDALIQARIPAETLLPETARALSGYLTFYLDREIIPTGYRLGSIEYSSSSAGSGAGSGAGDSGEVARLGVRLFNQDAAATTIASSEGALYLERHDTEWLITDLQIDFQTLADPYPRGQQKFIPSSYRWFAGGS